MLYMVNKLTYIHKISVIVSALAWGCDRCGIAPCAGSAVCAGVSFPTDTERAVSRLFPIFSPAGRVLAGGAARG